VKKVSCILLHLNFLLSCFYFSSSSAAVWFHTLVWDAPGKGKKKMTKGVIMIKGKEKKKFLSLIHDPSHEDSSKPQHLLD